MVFEDRVAKYPGRWTMVKSNGTSEIVTLIRNDEPTKKERQSMRLLLMSLVPLREQLTQKKKPFQQRRLLHPKGLKQNKRLQMLRTLLRLI